MASNAGLGGSAPSPPMYRKFVQGGVAAMAGASASHPLDLIKVRLQLQGEAAAGAGSRPVGPIEMARGIHASEGVAGLFSGLTASMLRQAVYSSVRFGVYDTIKDALGERPGERELSLVEKIGAGLGAGAVGAAVANPCDVAMVRMQADGKLPAEQRRNYKNVFDGLGRISRSEGVLALWKGCSPTVLRAMIVTASQFAAYDQLKQVLLAHGATDTPGTHLLAGFSAGFVASCTSTPVDTVKTRMMNSAPGLYRGPMQCAAQTIRTEGPLALYKGFVPTFVRQAPYLVVMFITLEQLKVFFKWVDRVDAPPARNHVAQH